MYSSKESAPVFSAIVTVTSLSTRQRSANRNVFNNSQLLPKAEKKI